MTVSGVKHECVNACLGKCGGSFKHIACCTDCGGADKAAARISCGVGVLNALFDIFDCDKSFKIAALVNERKLLDSVLHKNRFCLVERCADRCGYKVIFSHNLFDFNVEIGHEAHISVCEDSDELAAFIANRHARNFIFMAKRLGVICIMLGSQAKRRCDNSVL